jgi:hypothetical protein
MVRFAATYTQISKQQQRAAAIGRAVLQAREQAIARDGQQSLQWLQEEHTALTMRSRVH